MEKGRGTGFNIHYSHQNGHAERSAFNTAMNSAEAKRIGLSRGDIVSITSWVQKRHMRRITNSGTGK